MSQSPRNMAFSPISNRQASVLILGSMPSVASLGKRQYYAHPRNAFWPIMASLFGDDEGNGYQERCRMLRRKGIAVWDVLASCRRPGSLDAAIDDSSIIVNDFNKYFARHEKISWVFFNGGKSEQLYRKHVLPGLNEAWQHITYTRLPSTSPAMAALNLNEKIDRWRVVGKTLKQL
ncbi:MAG: DNA-deoxyinosine glycosylase [Pseudomonadales bacterium]